jgi:diadenosine tetraphosphate (Ap4A) HIT family hydrolase
MNTSTDTVIHRRVERLRAGSDPGCVARLASGWVVLADPQVIRGYCLLLPDPVVPQLNALKGAERARYLGDMAHTGDVLQSVLQATRINYAIFGNVDPALHAHVFPRRGDEPAGLVTAHPWAFDWGAAPKLSPERDRDLLERLRRAFLACG